jgi:hypothetical protein
MTFGGVTFGVSAPSGYLQSSSSTITKELRTIKSEDGNIASALPKLRTKRVVTVTTKGDVGLLPVSLGTFTDLRLTGARVAQTNDNFSESEATYSHYY